MKFMRLHMEETTLLGHALYTLAGGFPSPGNGLLALTDASDVVLIKGHWSLYISM